MTLSEFDRRCRGYHRRLADHKRPLRWLGTILLNVNRPENAPAQTEQEVMWLYGDPPPEVAPVLTPKEVAAEFARINALDADLL